jgi:crotonobetainyl-CoA:carnitine CoA-transferase CaiB-like acyl-CoA transferase
MVGVLHGLRILDLTFYLPGPYATLFLADLGAEVIKIENPAGGDPLRGLGPGGGDPAGSVFFRAMNRGKKSVTLDLKASEGQEVFFHLAAGADAVIEQFRPGVAARLGIDYEAVRKVNPRLAYVSLTGYGQDGPLSSVAGHDINYMARSGLLSLFQEGGRLPMPPLQIADLNGGNLAAMALMAGMLSARLTGEGSYADISMTDGLFSLMSVTAANYLAGGQPPERANLFLAGAEPPYNIYQAADGRFLSIGALEPKFWANLCRVLASADPEGKPAEVMAASREEAARVFASRPSVEWVALLEGLDVCVAPVLTVAEALDSDYVLSRGMVIEAPAGRQIGSPLSFTRSPEGGIRTPGAEREAGRTGPPKPAPRLGEHNREILSSLGRSEDDILALAARGVISESDGGISESDRTSSTSG